jgi:predicted aspartyl protease
MGEARVAIVVENPRTGARSEELTALADTGAMLTVVPATTLRQVGIDPGSLLY